MVTVFVERLLVISFVAALTAAVVFHVGSAHHPNSAAAVYEDD